MSKRRSVSDKYRMEITANEGCNLCRGTGISMEQTAFSGSRKIEIVLSVCMCVRVVPRLIQDAFAYEDPFQEEVRNG
jgi:hypothetical protein